MWKLKCPPPSLSPSLLPSSSSRPSFVSYAGVFNQIWPMGNTDPLHANPRRLRRDGRRCRGNAGHGRQRKAAGVAVIMTDLGGRSMGGKGSGRRRKKGDPLLPPPRWERPSRGGEREREGQKRETLMT